MTITYKKSFSVFIAIQFICFQFPVHGVWAAETRASQELPANGPAISVPQVEIPAVTPGTANRDSLSPAGTLSSPTTPASQNGNERLVQIDQAINQTQGVLDNLRSKADVKIKILSETAQNLTGLVDSKKETLQKLLDDFKALPAGSDKRAEADAFITELQMLQNNENKIRMNLLIQNRLELIDQEKQEWNWKVAAGENYLKLLQAYRDYIAALPAARRTEPINDEATLTDGTKLRWSDGKITQSTDSQGTLIRYVNGRMSSIYTSSGVYSLSENAEGHLKIKLDPAQGHHEYDLIPYLYRLSTEKEFQASSHPFVLNGNVKLDTTNPKSGEAGALFGGSGTISLNDSADWNFGTGNFTIDGWVKLNSLTNTQNFLAQGEDTNGSENQWRFYWDTTYLIFQQSQNGSQNIAVLGEWAPARDTWYHVAVTRSGNSFRLFVNGHQVGETAVDTDAVADFSDSLFIGGTKRVNRMNGWIDEVRISKGTARWTSTFQPPVQSDRDEATKLLLHFTSDEFQRLQEITAPKATQLPDGIEFQRDFALQNSLIPAAFKNQLPVPINPNSFIPNKSDIVSFLDAEIDKGRQLYEQAKKIRTDVLPNGKIRYHVYEGESIQGAIDRAKAGDVIYLEAGTYREQVVLKGGVNLKGAGYESVTLTGDFTTKSDVIVAMGGNIIEGLKIKGDGKAGGSVSSGINITDNDVDVRRCWFEGSLDNAVFLSFSGAALIEKNIFLNNIAAIQLPKNRTTIRNNTFVQNRIAINILNGTAPAIQNNIITGSSYQAIYEQAVGYAAVQNNSLFDNETKGGPEFQPPILIELKQGNRIQDPLFVNPAAGDYRLASNSPSQGRGALEVVPGVVQGRPAPVKGTQKLLERFKQKINKN